ncbi:MAG: transposase [Bdellovibrionaceae bacterium]|nr:transposase [Pseudobdellovibrionaceae bacterium]
MVLKSERARGQRALIRHINFIQSRIRSAARRFGVRVHGRAIHFNHIHLHVRGKTRVGTQNFFRVVAGHIAQEILDQHPLTAKEVRETPVGGRKFWADLVFTRVVAWGRDFRNVKNYLVKNIRQVEESLGVAYIEVLSQGAESG